MQDPSATSNTWPVEYEIVGSTSGAVEWRAPSSSKLALIRSLHDQLKNTQHQLKVVTAKVDVALSKALLAADAEKFLLDEVENLGKALKCESSMPFAPLSSFVECNLLLSSADVCLDSTAEARHVNMHLFASQTHDNSIADNFWADRSKAMKLTLLQDRIAQAGVLAEMS
jgi:hypothetical protein